MARPVTQDSDASQYAGILGRLERLERAISTIQGGGSFVWGFVTGTTGAVVSGSDNFTCSRSSAGSYAVNFNTAFSAVPAVGGIAVGARLLEISGITAAGITFVTAASLGGAGIDTNFGFIAVGPN